MDKIKSVPILFPVNVLVYHITFRPLIKWKDKGGKRTDCIAQAQVSAEVKGHIMKSRHKTDGHIWAEMGFIIQTKVTCPGQWERLGLNNKTTRPRPSEIRFNCQESLGQKIQTESPESLCSPRWLPNWTLPQTFLQLHHNYKHDATGFCGVMEGKGERETEEEEKWVKGTTGGNTILSWLWRGSGLIRSEETVPGSLIQTKQELKLCGLILRKLSRNVWTILQPQIKRRRIGNYILH